MSENIKVALRTEQGTQQMRRMRKSGRIPAVLYGHGEQNMQLSVDARDVAALVRHGSRFVELQGDVNHHAMVSDVQWDQIGVEVLHLDFLRININESVEVDLPVELRGEAAGVKEGGVLNFVLHEVTVSGPANMIPDKLELRINDLKLDESLTAGDIPLPAGVELITDPEEMVVDCQLPLAEAEVEPTAEAGAEPEVIGRVKDEDEDANADSDDKG